MTSILTFVLVGAAAGALYSLSALGVVLVYRASGVVNLASGAVGMVGTFVFWQLTTRSGWSPWVAVFVGIAVSAALGLAIHGAILRHLEQASGLTRLIAVLGVIVVLQAAATLRWPIEVQTVPSLLPTTRREVLPGVFVGEDRMWILLIALCLVGLLSVVYRRTLFGLSTSAVAENPRGVAALGYSVDRIAAINWAVGGALSGLTGIMMAPIAGLQITTGTLFVIPALAAALLGGMRSFWLTAAGGIGIGVLQACLTQYASRPGWPISVPFLTIIAVLVIRGRNLPLRAGAQERPPLLTSGRLRPGWILALVATYIGFITLVLSPRWIDAATTTMITAIIVLSVIVITGFAGQLSLAQMSMAGVGALIAGRLVAAWDVPFEIALLAGVLGTLPIALVLALPALRTRGVNLAVVTIGLAVTLQGLVFTDPWFTGGVVGTRVGSQTVFGIDVDAIAHPERYSLLVLAGLLVAVWMVANMRRGATGRELIAMRTNERAASALGINVVRSKLFAFGLAGMIAALGGILSVFRNTTIVYGTQFDVLYSIDVVMYAVVGGVGQLAGAVVGALMRPGALPSRVFEFIIEHHPTWFALVGGVITIVILIVSRDGLVGLHREHGRALDRLVMRVLRRTPPAARAVPVLDDEPADLGPVAPQVLSVRDLSVRFGGVQAVDGMSLEVRPGEVVGLIGPNGAGKSTVIEAITGFATPSGGTVTLGGADVMRLSAAARARRGLGRSFQGMEMFEGLTVLENLQVAADSRSLGRYAVDLVRPQPSRITPAMAAGIRELDLEPDLARYPWELSYGRRRASAIGRSIVARPSILLLDEPAAGLDDARSAALGGVIRRLAEEWGIGILLVEHHMDLVVRVCDRLIAMEGGRFLVEGAPEEVLHHPQVVDSYLGVMAS